MARNRILGGALAFRAITASQTTWHGDDGYLVNAPDDAPATITLDPVAVDGDQYTIQDVSGNASSQPIPIIASDARPIIGVGTSTTVDSDYGGIVLTFNHALSGWVAEEFTGSSSPAPISGVYHFSLETPVTLGMAVKIVSSDTCAPALADNASNMAFGIVKEILSSTTCEVLVVGEATISPPLSALTPTVPYYLSPTVPGGIQTAVPSTPGQIVQRMGFAKDTEVFQVEVGLPVQVSGANLTATVNTSAMTGGSGQAAYISGASAVSPTNASQAITPLGTPGARFFGFFEGTAGQVVVAGIVPDAQFVSGDGAPTNGSPVFLSATVAGKLTSVAPTTAGDVVAEVGICQDNSAFGGAATCIILIQPKAPMQL